MAENKKAILKGIKIADFSWAYVGPLSAKALADCGAEVIKIEGRSRPDVERSSVPPFKDNILGLNRGSHFNSVNTSKMSLCMNLSKPKAKEIAKQLVAWADIVIDNFSGGSMDRMGLGYGELKKVKPDIIMLSSAMQGQTGPDAERAGFGQHLTSFSGIGNLAGWPDRDPTMIGYYTDFIAPHYNIALIMAALLYRRRTGKGLYLDAAQNTGCAHFIAPLILNYQANGTIDGRMGNRVNDASPNAAFRCPGDDRWCAVTVKNDNEWKEFCLILGEPAWTKDARFASLAGRKSNEDELEKLIETWTLQHSPEEIMGIMQGAGIAAGVVQTGKDLMEKDPQMKSRNFYHEFYHPEVGKYRSPRPPYLFSKSEYDMFRAPLLGEHNEHILKDILGMSDDDIAGLVIDGVLE